MKKMILCFLLATIASVGAINAQNISASDADSIGIKKQPNGKNRVSVIFYIPDVEDSVAVEIQRLNFAAKLDRVQNLENQLKQVKEQLKADSTRAADQLRGKDLKEVFPDNYKVFAGNWNYFDGNDKTKVSIDSIGTVFDNKNKAIGRIDVASSNGKKIFLTIGDEKNSLIKNDDESYVNEKRKLKLERQKDR